MAKKSGSLAIRRRRESRHEEYATQRQLIDLLVRHVDQSRVFFTSLENRPSSPLAAMFQARRGCRRGLPDILLLHAGGRAIFLELKSRRGRPSPAQREAALEIQATGTAWYLARTPAAALTALHMEGVGLGRWRPPKRLRPWEGPFSDPNQRLPMNPQVAREQRAARRRWRARARARQREAARLEAQSAAAISGPQVVASDARPA